MSGRILFLRKGKVSVPLYSYPTIEYRRSSTNTFIPGGTVENPDPSNDQEYNTLYHFESTAEMQLRSDWATSHEITRRFLKTTRTYDSYPNGTLTSETYGSESFTIPVDASSSDIRELTVIDPPETGQVIISFQSIEILTPPPGANTDGYNVPLEKARPLKVAKWEKAFDMSGSTPVVHSDFNDRDPDRFYHRVPMPWAEGNGTATVKIKVSGSEGVADPENLIEIPGSPGLFRTNALILVSNDVDDEHGGTDEGLDDGDPQSAPRRHRDLHPADARRIRSRVHGSSADAGNRQPHRLAA